VTQQFGASLTDDSRVVIYRNKFIIQATGAASMATKKVLEDFSLMSQPGEEAISVDIRCQNN
jgi:hypothetical protein